MRVNSLSKKVNNGSPKKVIRHVGDGNQKTKAVTSGCISVKSAETGLGTVDRVIQENKIFTAIAMMPDEVQRKLLNNGWIGKDFNNKNPNAVLSLHKNSERAKAVAERYDNGLIWIDQHSRRVNWSDLRPTVVVNRFPRDANAELKLCGHSLAGNHKFDGHFPRTYPVAEVAASSRFALDYSITACVSLLHVFLNAGSFKFTKNGQVPLSAIEFAVNMCDRYGTSVDANGPARFSCTGSEWTTFFDHYYKIAHEHKRFQMPADVAAMNALLTSSSRVIGNVKQFRPQMCIDGNTNAWTIKSSRSTGHRPVLVNRMDEILKRCSRIDGDATADSVIQKYVETPLVAGDERFDVRAWIVVSTLDKCLSVWLYRKCCVYKRVHKLSVDSRDRGRPLSPKSRRHPVRVPVVTCDFAELKRKLSRVAAGLTDEHRSNDICAVIRRAIELVVMQASTDVLALRPNCFELFQVTFAVGEDFRPWLIDIESDPWTAADHHIHHAESSVSSGVAKALAKFVTRTKGRAASNSTIGTFDLLHRTTGIPGVPYEPRRFAEKNIAKKCRRPRSKIYNNKSHSSFARAWDDDNISTCIQNVRDEDVVDYCPSPYFSRACAAPNTGTTDVAECHESREDEPLCLGDLFKSMARLRNGPTIDHREAKHCLHLLDRWKARVMSAHEFYKQALARNKPTSLVSQDLK